MSNDSLLRTLKLSGVLIFDIAVLVAFIKMFSVLFIMAPVKLAFMFIVLLAGLCMFSGSVMFPKLLGRSGIVYPIATVTVSILYLCVSNLISVIFIAGSTVWYIGWELLVFAVWIGIFSVFVMFAKRAAEDRGQAGLEQSSMMSIHMQLNHIEESLTARQHVEGILPIIKSFKLLKERISASTPFGRITGNSAIFELEHTIRGNLDYLQLYIRSNALDQNIVDMQNLIDETRRLIVNREALNVR